MKLICGRTTFMPGFCVFSNSGAERRRYQQRVEVDSGCMLPVSAPAETHQGPRPTPAKRSLHTARGLYVPAVGAQLG
jgi:hypothetical protein